MINRYIIVNIKKIIISWNILQYFTIKNVVDNDEDCYDVFNSKIWDEYMYIFLNWYDLLFYLII